MEEKKKSKKKKKEESQLLFYLLLGLAVVALLVLLIGKNIVPEKNYYEVKERTEKVNTTVVEKEDEKYDTIGWLQLQGTNIDYPLVHNPLGDEYSGYIDQYVWLENAEPEYQKHMIISGHNILNLSSKPELKNKMFTRFEEAMSYVYYDFAKDNKYIQLTFDGKEYVYKIFAVAFVPYEEAVNFPVGYDYTDEQLSTYIKKMKELSLYDYSIDVTEDDNLITLITCTRFYGINSLYEFRIIGRLAREGEVYDNYKVEKSKNYHKVEEILKGDDDEDEDI